MLTDSQHNSDSPQTFTRADVERLEEAWFAIARQAKTLADAMQEPHATRQKNAYTAYRKAQALYLNIPSWMPCEEDLAALASAIENAPQADSSVLEAASAEIVTQADLQPVSAHGDHLTGVVTKWNTATGEGLIKAGTETFMFARRNLCHFNMPLVSGDTVTFNAYLSTAENAGMPRAINITIPGYTPPARVSTLGPMAQAAKQAVQEAREAKRNAVRKPAPTAAEYKAAQ